MKITVELKDGVFHPSNQYDKQQILKLKGNIFTAEIKQGRTYARLGEYWLIMGGLEKTYSFAEYDWAQHFGLAFVPDNRHGWHMMFKCLFLPMEEFINPITGGKMLYPPSTAFDKMDEIEFNVFLDAIKEWLLIHKISDIIAGSKE